MSASRRPPVALVSGEPIRQRMGGVGVRYLELARHLANRGFPVRLLGIGEALAPDPPPGVEIRNLVPDQLPGALRGQAAAVAQGRGASEVLTRVPGLPTAVDLYDPWLVENLSYAREHGAGILARDLDDLRHQLRGGDFFLCSGEAQRLHYLGALTALGRLDLVQHAADPDLRQLIDVVPFPVPELLPEHLQLLPEAGPEERRVLFGGVYEWYDPWTLLEALPRLETPGVRVIFVRPPNPETTPRGLAARLEEHCQQEGLVPDRVEFLDWMPAARRFDLLREVQALAAPDLPCLETRLSLRTRYLDALAVGCPVVATEGGALAELLRRHRAGEVVPPGDPAALAAALDRALVGEGVGTEGVADLLAGFRPEAALGPLVEFLQSREAPVVQARSRTRAPGLRRLSVLIPTWDNPEDLAACLEALRAQQDPGVAWEVLVYDNGSGPGTREVIEAAGDRVRALHSPVNRGFATAINRLARATDADLLALLNDDSLPAPDWLARLVARLDAEDQDVAAVAGLVLDEAGTRLDFAGGVVTFDGHALQRGYHHPLEAVRLPPPGAELPFPCGASALVRRRDFLEVGGLDEDFFAYYEDVDLGWRLWSAGRRVVFEPAARSRHRSRTTSARLGDSRRGFLFERNAFATIHKNLEPGLWESLMPAVLLTFQARTARLLRVNDEAGLLVPRPDRTPPPLSPLALRDPRACMQLAAQAGLMADLDRMCARRAEVQARRRRPDLELLTRFPLHLVPTYPGDQELFASPGFRSWLPADLPLVEAPLSDFVAAP